MSDTDLIYNLLSKQLSSVAQCAAKLLQPPIPCPTISTRLPGPLNLSFVKPPPPSTSQCPITTTRSPVLLTSTVKDQAPSTLQPGAVCGNTSASIQPSSPSFQSDRHESQGIASNKFLDTSEEHVERRTAVLESLVRPDLERWRRLKKRRRRPFEKKMVTSLGTNVEKLKMYLSFPYCSRASNYSSACHSWNACRRLPTRLLSISLHSRCFTMLSSCAFKLQ